MSNIINSGNKDAEDVSISNNPRNMPSNFNKSAIGDSNKKYTTFIGGIAGGLLSACLSCQIPCAAILVPSSSGIPDPEGAAILIESYNSIIKNEELKINLCSIKRTRTKLKKTIRANYKIRTRATRSGTYNRSRIDVRITLFNSLVPFYFIWRMLCCMISKYS